ncbi:hypothetical protein M0802_009459 [Mischocyttarus mexicanus]|nr:hypothetical protein M0802_009459 [Mischocyttarus mexicanus]
MPKVCTDPRCPLNKYTNTQKKSQKDSCKIHGKPCVTFSSDHHRALQNHRENKRTKFCRRLCPKKDPKLRETIKVDHCGTCCKNKRCRVIKSTIERGTSTDSLQMKRSRKHGIKINYYNNEKNERYCECRRKRCCDRKIDRTKGKRIRCRSRRKRKRKYSWFTNCLRKLCFCVKTPKSYEESDTYAKSHTNLLQNCECCNTYKDKRKGTSKKSRHSKNHIFLPDEKKTLIEDYARYHRSSEQIYDDRKCRCINTVTKNRMIPQHQSYLQDILSKGFNVIRRGINFCM